VRSYLLRFLTTKKPSDLNPEPRLISRSKTTASHFHLTSQLGKLYNPRSLSAFHALGGLDGLEKGFRSERKTGLGIDKARLGGTVMFSDTVAKGEAHQKIDEIHGHFGGESARTLTALGDTGAKSNFITESYAKEHSLPIQRNIFTSVRMDAARKVTTVNRVSAIFRFEGEIQKHSLELEVLPKGPYGLILGKAFMKATKTFSNLKLRTSRVKVRCVKEFANLQLLYLGDSATHFTGLLNGRTLEALGDSSAKGLVMSEAHALSRNIDIVRDPSHEVVVQFANGSTRKTQGMAYNVMCEYGLGEQVNEHTLDFHVLRDAPANVILSDEFLYDTEAFAAYDRYLIDVDEEDEEGHLFAIKLSKLRVQKGMH
jgi:hypothetical protein